MGTGTLGEVVVVRGGVGWGGGGVYWWDPGREPTAYCSIPGDKKIPYLYPKNIESETPILHGTDQFPIK